MEGDTLGRVTAQPARKTRAGHSAQGSTAAERRVDLDTLEHWDADDTATATSDDDHDHDDGHGHGHGSNYYCYCYCYHCNLTRSISGPHPSLITLWRNSNPSLAPCSQIKTKKQLSTWPSWAASGSESMVSTYLVV